MILINFNTKLNWCQRACHVFENKLTFVIFRYFFRNTQVDHLFLRYYNLSCMKILFNLNTYWSAYDMIQLKSLNFTFDHTVIHWNQFCAFPLMYLVTTKAFLPCFFLFFSYVIVTNQVMIIAMCLYSNTTLNKKQLQWLYNQSVIWIYRAFKKSLPYFNFI